MRKHKAFYYTFWVALAGLILTGLFIYVEWQAQANEKEKLPYIRLGETVQAQVTGAMDKWEQLQSGTTSSRFNENIAVPLKQSLALLQAAFEGKPTALGYFDATDEETLLLLRSTVLELDTWLNTAQQINQLKQSGSEEGVESLVAKMKTAQTAITNAMTTLIDTFQGRYKQAVAFLNLLSWISIGLSVAIFGTFSFFVYRAVQKSERQARETQLQLDRDEKRMGQLTGFIEAVSSGNYDVQLEESSQDHVSETLVRMRTKLKDNAELEKRRNWATSGQAEIGEILRATGSSAELFDNIIRFIVKYTHSNQGGLFILNDDDANDVHLDLVACYAFERKKFLTKKVAIGNGIVGQCFLERAKIHLTEVPDDYVNITSGLGGTTPRAIMVVPLKVNEDVFGVLELASFQPYESHEVELVEKFGENIAATVSSVKTNERTRELLEQTQQQAEEMKSQEEEMRQNMEELSATQEQQQRLMAEAEGAKLQLTQRENVFSINTILSEADKFGTITYANRKLSEVSKYSHEELIGQGHNIFRHPDMPSGLFKLMWDTIQRGETFQGIVKNRAKDGSHYWVDATIVPVRNTEGEVYKYIGARYHIVADQLAEELYNRQARKLGLPELKPAS